MKKSKALGILVEFLNEIGIETRIVAGSTGFLRGVRIEAGGLLVDPCCHVSDVLHEAGHLAIFPSRYRPWVNGNVAKAQRLMFDDLALTEPCPDSPLYRAAIQTSDSEATAWAFAAGVHLGFRENQIILARQYQGEGGGLRIALGVGAYHGIHGLAHAGFCATNRLVAQARGIPLYPKLAMWLQV